LFRDPKGAESMSYQRRETEATISALQQNNGQLEAYSDFIHGSEYLGAVWEGWITDEDVVRVPLTSALHYHMHVYYHMLFCWYIVYTSSTCTVF
ncbi:hypothetical protein L208DRAFT_1347618, partial [Tricholoma matsutake]